MGDLWVEDGWVISGEIEGCVARCCRLLFLINGAV